MAIGYSISANRMQGNVRVRVVNEKERERQVPESRH